MGEPGGLPSMGSHRVGHDWSDLAAAAAAGQHSLRNHPADSSVSAMATSTSQRSTVVANFFQTDNLLFGFFFTGRGKGGGPAFYLSQR